MREEVGGGALGGRRACRGVGEAGSGGGEEKKSGRGRGSREERGGGGH